GHPPKADETMLIGLHTHTRYGSNCSYSDPSDLVRQAKQAGLDGVCITEHELCWEAPALERLSQENGFPVFGGVEVETDCGPVLAFGIRGPLWGVASARELRRLVDASQGFMVACHPFRGDAAHTPEPSLDTICARPIFGLVDAVEVFNGSSHRRELELALRVLERLGMKGVAGSDSHAVHTVGQCATRFHRPVATEAEMVAELRAGRFEAVHRRLGLTY
ncbi:MAG: PHP domain-containing protein, partial [Chloroflexota bacterium]